MSQLPFTIHGQTAWANDTLRNGLERMWYIGNAAPHDGGLALHPGGTFGSFGDIHGFETEEQAIAFATRFADGQTAVPEPPEASLRTQASSLYDKLLACGEELRQPKQPDGWATKGALAEYLLNSRGFCPATEPEYNALLAAIDAIWYRLRDEKGQVTGFLGELIET